MNHLRLQELPDYSRKQSVLELTDEGILHVFMTRGIRNAHENILIAIKLELERREDEFLEFHQSRVKERCIRKLNTSLSWPHFFKILGITV